MTVKLPEVPSFVSVPALIEAQRRRANMQPVEMYPRDGTLKLAAFTDTIAELVGIPSQRVVLYPSGMLAVAETLELTRPTAETTIVHGDGLYSQSNWYITQELKGRGVKTVQVDGGSLSDIIRAIGRHRPNIVFFETVANSQSMSVLPIEEFLSHETVKRVNPLIVLDNTLPTPSGLPMREILNSTDLDVIVVESGTKYYGLNREMLGVAYSNKEELIQRLLDRRKRRGPTPSPSAVLQLAKIIPPSKEEFDRRNLQTLQNTFSLAEAAQEAEIAGGAFVVMYPNLSSHSNSEYANKRFPFGASPVLFIGATRDDRLDHYDITTILWNNPVIRHFCKLGQSFGFNETRIWPDDRSGNVRIAGGTEDGGAIYLIGQAIRDSLQLANTASKTSKPTGEVILTGSDGKHKIYVRKQSKEETCGEACLEMLGYAPDQFVEEGGGVSTAGIFFLIGAEDMVDRFGPDYRVNTPHMALGVRKETGMNHWFLWVNDRTIIDPLTGKKVNAQRYLREEIGEIKALMPIPFPDPLIK